MQKIRVGIVGYGLSASIFHVPILNTMEGFEIVKVVSSNKEKVHSTLPNVEIVADIQSLLLDASINLVIICSPNVTHFPYARAALNASKHVVVEKPFVIRSKEAAELIRLGEMNDLVLSVYQNRRWDNDFLTIRKCIESGVLGEICTYEEHYDRFRPQVSNKWRDEDVEGSGTLYDLGSHLIDQAIQLFGLPETITADVFAQRKSAKTSDYFHLVLGYGKLRVILHSGSLVQQPGPRFSIHGTNGSLMKYGTDCQESLLKQGKLPGNPMWGRDDEQFYADLILNLNGVTMRGKVETVRGCYEAYYEGIYIAITEGKPVPVSPIDAMNTIKVIEYALQSSEEQSTVNYAY